MVSFIDVKVTSLDDSVVEGRLVRVTADTVVVNDGSEKSVALNDVVGITVSSAKPPQAAPAKSLINLQDGSILPVNNVAATADDVSAVSAVLGELKVPREAVRAIRLQPQKEEWGAEWAAFLKRSNDKDLLIVPKRDGSGLDFLAGVVTSVTAEQVPFLLDGDEIPVPLARVFGVVFAKAEAAHHKLSGGAAVDFHGGTLVRVSDVLINEKEIVLDASWGQKLSAATELLSAIDLSEGRIHYLSDLDPVSERYFGLDGPGRSWGALFAQDRSTRAGLSRKWKMSRDHFPNWGQPPLKLRDRIFRKGICIFPSAKIEYPLDERYTSLKAKIGVDDEVAFNQLSGKQPTAVELRIEADGEEVFQKLISAPDDPIDLDLDLKGVTTLAFVVDFGDGSSACDYLDIADAKLIVDTTIE